MKTIYEVWCKGSPLTVQERAEDGVTLSYLVEGEAIGRAKQLHKNYPNIHFIVRECSYKYASSSEYTARLVYDTSNENQHPQT